jgi:hypothetical protein
MGTGNRLPNVAAGGGAAGARRRRARQCRACLPGALYRRCFLGANTRTYAPVPAPPPCGTTASSRVRGACPPCVASPHPACIATLQGRSIHEATRRLPIIGDADTGYGNAVNGERAARARVARVNGEPKARPWVARARATASGAGAATKLTCGACPPSLPAVKRTVRGYAAAGFAGILIEDQVRGLGEGSSHPRSHTRARTLKAGAAATTRMAADADVQRASRQAGGRAAQGICAAAAQGIHEGLSWQAPPLADLL